MNIIEIKKELYKTKAMAKLAYYIAGNLYYEIDLFGKTYKFPISTVDTSEDGTISLSNDLGTTEFLPEVRGSELARWIQMAIKSNEFLEVID